MSSVYFDPALGGDGTTVTDDGNPSTGLAAGGHRTRFVPALAQIVAIATNVITSATQAATSASTATTKAADANTYAGNAQTAATNAAASYDAFDDRYLGSKSSDPALDNDGNALLTGAIYWRTTSPIGMKVWNGSAWVAVALSSAAANGISCTPTGNLSATDVQAALAELDGDITASRKEIINVISGNTTAVAQNSYIATAALTLTLPASLAAGEWIEVVNLTGSTTALIIDPNGFKINGVAGNMTVNRLGASFRLTNSGNSTIGVVIK